MILFLSVFFNRWMLTISSCFMVFGVLCLLLTGDSVGGVLLGALLLVLGVVFVVLECSRLYKRFSLKK